MINLLFIETEKRPKGETLNAHVRNCLELKKDLPRYNINIDIMFTEECSKKYQKKYDIILFSYSSKRLPLFIELEKVFKINNNSLWGWFSNEYNISPNGEPVKIFKERFPNTIFISNYEKSVKSYKYLKNQYCINFNSLFYKPKNLIRKKYNYIYYGTYRKDRRKSFEKYIKKNIYISTSKKNHKFYKNINRDYTAIDKLSWKKNTLSLFRYSFYIEDEYTHNNFNNLSNRFYENLSHNCVTLFDRSCLNTLEKSELEDYEEFLVDSYDDILKFDEHNFEENLRKQEKWHSIIIKEREEMLFNFSEVIKNEIKKNNINSEVENA